MQVHLLVRPQMSQPSLAAQVVEVVGANAYVSSQPLKRSSSSSLSICGDDVRTTAEACDDNNTISGEGCDSSCVVESGHVCTGSSCTTVRDRLWRRTARRQRHV